MELVRARRKAKHGDTGDLEFLSEFDDREPGEKALGKLVERFREHRGRKHGADTTQTAGTQETEGQMSKAQEKAGQRQKKQAERAMRKEAARKKKAEQRAEKD